MSIFSCVSLSTTLETRLVSLIVSFWSWKSFNYKTNERLQKALELKLFEDQKDTIKLTSLVSNVVDKDTQEKIDIVKGRLIRSYGYDEDSATDVLNYVASIFARGDVKRGSH